MEAKVEARVVGKVEARVEAKAEARVEVKVVRHHPHPAAVSVMTNVSYEVQKHFHSIFHREGAFGVSSSIAWKISGLHSWTA